MKWVLVTGSSGYIGSILCHRLTEAGYNVIGVDLEQPLHAGGTEIFIQDCFTGKRVLQHIEHYKVQTIYHLAAHSLLGPSATQPAKYYENNSGRTARFVEQLCRVNFINASTAAVYREQDHPLVEADPIGSPNVYGRSKYICEQILEDVAPIHQLNAVSFRFFNVIGAYKRLKQRDTEPHLLNQIRLCQENLGRSLQIFGNDYPTRDGYCVRDFVNVLDICDAMMHAALIAECAKHNNQFANKHTAYNLGSGTGTTVSEMLSMVARVTGRPVLSNVVSRRVGDPAFLVANPQKFIDDTGFVYKHTIEQAITSVME